MLTNIRVITNSDFNFIGGVSRGKEKILSTWPFLADKSQRSHERNGNGNGGGQGFRRVLRNRF